MQTIRRRLSILFFICSITAILLITLFVNITISNKFNQYMVDTQNKRYERIVSYFEEVYKRQGKWTEDSGIELMHEAYMGNYCLTLIIIIIISLYFSKQFSVPIKEVVNILAEKLKNQDNLRRRLVSDISHEIYRRKG